VRIVLAVSVTSKPFPGQPSHRWCPGQTILQTEGQGDQAGQEQQHHSRHLGVRMPGNEGVVSANPEMETRQVRDARTQLDTARHSRWEEIDHTHRLASFLLRVTKVALDCAESL